MFKEDEKPTILIVEDELGPRNALKVILRPFYNLQAVDNGHAAIRALKENTIDLVTLDMKLPDRQGMDLLQQIKGERDDVEVVIITGYGSLKSAMDAIRYGAAAYLLKPFNVTELLAVINQTLGKKQRLAGLRFFLKQSEALWGGESESSSAWQQLRELYQKTRSKQKTEARTAEGSDTTALLSEILEAKNRDLYNHSSRTSFYAGLLGKHLALADEGQKALAIGSFLHDIGQIGLDDRLLDKKLKLDAGDSDLFKRHPEIGSRLILPLRVPPEVGQIILYHHERYDGLGYPYGLQGDGIPFLARIVAIAQAFDHLTAEHTSQSAPLTVHDALQHIRQGAGAEFDPALAQAFARIASESAASLPTLAASSKPALIPEN
ncbi:MAG TPA: HD domain-containing phosphohydrolase [Nitrospiraceae bacterium]|nr:HD domain-containing phosphohydrolase [Nitrospiraceae bacterium]